MDMDEERFYPSFDALRLADKMVNEIGAQTPGYEGRIGAAWYWKLPAGIMVKMWLGHTVTEERWDLLRARASTHPAGVFSAADFPFAAYATSATSPPFIHDMKGVAEWSNRLYFQMGDLIGQAVHWIGLLHAVAISPQISKPASMPIPSPLERRLVKHAMEELGGAFTIERLYEAFRDELSKARLRSLAQKWEARDLLTPVPRRVTYALRMLVQQEDELEPPTNAEEETVEETS